MWLFSQRGFYSIVQHKERPDYFVVKARVKGDIEKYWPFAEIERNENFDYLYRAVLHRTEVEEVILKMVLNIDYTSFKGSLEDKRRYAWYVQLWEVLCMMQEAFRFTEDEDGTKSKTYSERVSDRP